MRLCPLTLTDHSGHASHHAADAAAAARLGRGRSGGCMHQRGGFEGVRWRAGSAGVISDQSSGEWVVMTTQRPMMAAGQETKGVASHRSRQGEGSWGEEEPPECCSPWRQRAGMGRGPWPRGGGQAWLGAAEGAHAGVRKQQL